MRIGIDFDNTLVNYDKIFKSIAQKMGLADTGNAKAMIKTHFLGIDNGISQWKELQALVYGEYIKDAYFLPDFIDFYNFARENHIDLFIISYKTEYGFTTTGKISLHKAANSWIESEINFFPRENIYFEPTMTKKILRIKSLNLNAHIDDLISVFKHRSFPSNIKRVLFSTQTNKIEKKEVGKFKCIKNWSEAIEMIGKHQNILS